MLQKTNGIVLRSIKYGETSLVTNIFTSVYGVQTYMVQGVRTATAKRNRAAALQPATLLNMVVYQQPQKNMQRIKEFDAAYIYTSLHEEVVKNSIALFSVEVLLRLLPEHAPLPEVFDLAYDYFIQIDKMPLQAIANFPLYFIIQCSRIMGYELKGGYSEETPYLNLQEGAFTSNPPLLHHYLNDEDARAIDHLLPIEDVYKLAEIQLSAATRFRLLEWYIAFLQQHSQHMGNIKSMAVLQAILH